VELSVRLCLLTCEEDIQPSAAAAAATTDADDN